MLSKSHMSSQYQKLKVFAIKALGQWAFQEIWQPCICCLSYLFSHYYTPLSVKRQTQCVKQDIAIAPLNSSNTSAAPVND